MSSSAILRLTKSWTAEYEAFRRRDLADRDYVYLWADGVHFTIRLEEERLCTLVVTGMRPDGTKEVVALGDSYRESAESWRTLLRDLKRRGLRASVLARQLAHGRGGGVRVHDLVQRLFGPWLQAARELVQHVDDPVHPAPLLGRLGPDVAHGRQNPSAPSPTALQPGPTGPSIRRRLPR